MVTDAEIQAAATAYGFPPDLGGCVLRRFVASVGRLPNSRAELCSWATANGLRNAAGEWSCTEPPASAAQLRFGLSPEQQARARAWIAAHPIETGAIGLTLYWLLMRFGQVKRPGRPRRGRRRDED